MDGVASAIRRHHIYLCSESHENERDREKRVMKKKDCLETLWGSTQTPFFGHTKSLTAVVPNFCSGDH